MMSRIIQCSIPSRIYDIFAIELGGRIGRKKAADLVSKYLEDLSLAKNWESLLGNYISFTQNLEGRSNKSNTVPYKSFQISVDDDMTDKVKSQLENFRSYEIKIKADRETEAKSVFEQSRFEWIDFSGKSDDFLFQKLIEYSIVFTLDSEQRLAAEAASRQILLSQ